MSMIEKIRKARQQTVDAGGFSFTITRPTDMQAVEMQDSKIRQSDMLTKFVIGWEGVTELDIIPGGTNVPVAFSTDLFIEWIADRPMLWSPLSDAIISSYQAHVEALGNAEKKPVIG